MSGLQDTEARTWKQRFLSPWAIAISLVSLFLVIQAWQYWGDRAVIAALDNDPAFATPEMKLEFSRTIQYDPLSFVGRGAHAGFWSWSPQGLNLTEQGSQYFRLEEGKIISQASAGRRRLTRIRLHTPREGGQEIEFFYEWLEISPAATALLRPAPVLGQEFLARAVLMQEPEGWRVQSFEARDFEEPLARLQAIASGVRK